MFEWLMWVPILPLAGFLTLALIGRRLPRPLVATLGVGSVLASAIVSCLIAARFLSSPPPGETFTQTLFTWIPVEGLNAQFSLHLDALSLVMILVVGVVASLILLYSVRFMRDDAGYSRFFAWMDLFVASMLVLVLAGDLLFLYLGWEAVGLCSFLLIGFWYRDPANVAAARKAFIVTRVGDVAFAVGLFLLFTSLGSSSISELMRQAAVQWPVGSGLALAAALLLLGGAVGKSAQLPLQTWLPDAMAGPTPVSALIHAATLVTAGVYLIARMHVVFTLAPVAMTVVAVLGAATLVLAGCAALAQHDIKRVLAYSTMSQVGYMFLALGVGAWSAGIFHFMIHAFFKALLFMAAGVVILGLKGEHNMFKMGGLWRRLPGTCWAFLAGAASLAAFPLVTAGFYSKDLILFSAWQSSQGSPWLWAAALVGALLTSLYTFRMVFLVFFGELRQMPTVKPGFFMGLPLVILAVLSLVAGFIEMPASLGGYALFADFLARVLPGVVGPFVPMATQSLLMIFAAVVSLSGILVAWLLYARSHRTVNALMRSPVVVGFHRLWLSGWGFDRAYNAAFVAPFLWLTRLNRNDFTDLLYVSLARLSRGAHGLLSDTQSGNVRWYAVGIAVGAIVLIAIVVLL